MSRPFQLQGTGYNNFPFRRKTLNHFNTDMKIKGFVNNKPFQYSFQNTRRRKSRSISKKKRSKTPKKRSPKRKTPKTKI
jgi:hypothetical protein